jgi:hypothetical protein
MHQSPSARCIAADPTGLAANSITPPLRGDQSGSVKRSAGNVRQRHQLPDDRNLSVDRHAMRSTVINTARACAVS